MKQIFSILLAVLLLASLSFAAFAEAGDEESYDDWDWDNSLAVERPDIGLVLHIPADIGDAFALQGHIEFEYGEELSYGSGAYYTELGYFAMSDEEYEAMDELDDSRYLPLLTFVCVRNGCDMSAFQNAGLDINWENSWQMATVDNYTHYLFVGREDEYLPETFVEPYGSEYLSLVSSQELFSGNEVTMINIWATWCGPCRGELPDLARINSNLESIGCGIVGLLADGQDPEDVEDAKQLLQDAGVYYPVVNIPEGADDMFDLSGMPVSYFVNSDGEILADPVHGAQVNAYEQAVRNILTGNNPG